MTKNGRPVVQSIATATSVVELLARESSIGLSSAARSLGISKATLLRTLETLKSAGWVEQDPPPSWHWRLSEQFLKLGQSATSDQRLRQVSIDAMHLLNQETRETVHLAAAQVDHLVLIERLDSSFADRKSTRLNSSHVSISYAVFCLKKKIMSNKNIYFIQEVCHIIAYLTILLIIFLRLFGVIDVSCDKILITSVIMYILQLFIVLLSFLMPFEALDTSCYNILITALLISTLQQLKSAISAILFITLY